MFSKLSKLATSEITFSTIHALGSVRRYVPPGTRQPFFALCDIISLVYEKQLPSFCQRIKKKLFKYEWFVPTREMSIYLGMSFVSPLCVLILLLDGKSLFNPKIFKLALHLSKHLLFRDSRTHPPASSTLTRPSHLSSSSISSPSSLLHHISTFQTPASPTHTPSPDSSTLTLPSHLSLSSISSPSSRLHRILTFQTPASPTHTPSPASCTRSLPSHFSFSRISSPSSLLHCAPGRRNIRREFLFHFNKKPLFQNFVVTHVVHLLKQTLPLSSIAQSLDARNTATMYSHLLRIPLLHRILPSKYKCQQHLRDESDLLLHLHPSFTPDGVSLCPFRVFEVLLEVFRYKYKRLPKTVNLQTMLDGTVIGKGALSGKRVLTPTWLSIVPNEPDWLDHDESISVDDSVLISIHLAGDDAFHVKRNCSRLIMFHETCRKKNEKITVSLKEGTVSVSLNRLLVCDKCALKSLGATDLEGDCIFNCTCCKLMTKRKDLGKISPLGLVDDGQYRTIFSIKAMNIFDDLRFHGIKRCAETLIYRLIRDVCALKSGHNSEIEARGMIIDRFEKWIQSFRPSYHLVFSSGKHKRAMTLQPTITSDHDSTSSSSSSSSTSSSSSNGLSPMPMKFTWANVKGLFESYREYIPTIDSKPNTLLIWEKFERMNLLIRTKATEITDQVISEAKETGEELQSLLEKRWLDDEFTPYLHSICFHSHTFLKRAKFHNSSLKLLGDLQVMEKNNDVVKVIIMTKTNRFSSFNAAAPCTIQQKRGRKKKLATEETCDVVANQCGVMRSKGKPCKMNVLLKPCIYHDQPLDPPEPAQLPITYPSLECNCPGMHPKQSNLIGCCGNSEHLLSPIVQFMLRIDLENLSKLDPGVGEERKKYLEKVLSERKSEIDGRGGNWKGYRTNKDDICRYTRKLGFSIPSAATKSEAVAYFLRAYRAELDYRTSDRFDGGGLQNWNTHTLVQCMKVKWRRFLPVDIQLKYTLDKDEGEKEKDQEDKDITME
jgi:hypothetical protein